MCQWRWEDFPILAFSPKPLGILGSLFVHRRRRTYPIWWWLLRRWRQFWNLPQTFPFSLKHFCLLLAHLHSVCSKWHCLERRDRENSLVQLLYPLFLLPPFKWWWWHSTNTVSIPTREASSSMSPFTFHYFFPSPNNHLQILPLCIFFR